MLLLHRHDGLVDVESDLDAFDLAGRVREEPGILLDGVFERHGDMTDDDDEVERFRGGAAE